MRGGICALVVAALFFGAGVAEGRGRSRAAPAAPAGPRGSIALGRNGHGRLVGAMRLPARGRGYLVPRTWATRGNNWGTDELVGLVVRVGRRVREQVPGSTLYVADLSPRRGGATEWHRSHQNGLDVDLIFYAMDRRGRQVPPPVEMPRFSAAGRAEQEEDDGRRESIRFDVARNWALVRALLCDRGVEIDKLFIAEPLARKLLDHAEAIGEPEALRDRAAALLHQPSDSEPHDDHLHVRIRCSAEDRAQGCGETLSRARGRGVSARDARVRGRR